MLYFSCLLFYVDCLYAKDQPEVFLFYLVFNKSIGKTLARLGQEKKVQLTCLEWKGKTNFNLEDIFKLQGNAINCCALISLKTSIKLIKILAICCRNSTKVKWNTKRSYNHKTKSNFNRREPLSLPSFQLNLDPRLAGATPVRCPSHSVWAEAQPVALVACQLCSPGTAVRSLNHPPNPGAV